jgi:hypothetical protein
VLPDGGHHRVPADAELCRHLAHRAGVAPHLATALGAGAVGQKAPRRERRRLLGPGARRAPSLLAAEAPLGPAKARRPAEGRQIPVLDLHAIVGDRHHAAGRAADQPGEGLDHDHHLGGALSHVQHPEPGQAEHGLGNAGSVTHVRSLLVVAAFVSRNDDGGSWRPLSRYSLRAAPHPDRKSRISTRTTSATATSACLAWQGCRSR